MKNPVKISLEYVGSYGWEGAAPGAYMVRYAFDDKPVSPPTAPDGEGKWVRYDFAPDWLVDAVEGRVAA